MRPVGIMIVIFKNLRERKLEFKQGGIEYSHPGMTNRYQILHILQVYFRAR